MLERAIIDHASPTLAGLKLGNLFNYRCTDGFEREFEALKGMLHQKGVALRTLRQADGKALIYVYRPAELARTLEDGATRSLLIQCGYDRFDVDGALLTLRGRLNEGEAFPHEIGVFLGYPLEDVLGFIENGGKNCLSCGCWKVYSDPCTALAAFKRFEKCKSVYQKRFAEGCPLLKLTVAPPRAS